MRNETDNMIDMQDSIYSSLLIWKDMNQDAKTDDGELMSLIDAGVLNLSLGFSSSGKVVNDNSYAQVGSYQDIHHVNHEMVDVWFSTNHII